MYDPIRRTRNIRHFELIYADPQGERRMTIAVKGVATLPNGDVRFEVWCHETERYEHILSSLIRKCTNLKTNRSIRDLGRRYTVNRGR